MPQLLFATVVIDTSLPVQKILSSNLSTFTIISQGLAEPQTLNIKQIISV